MIYSKDVLTILAYYGLTLTDVAAALPKRSLQFVEKMFAREEASTLFTRLVGIKLGIDFEDAALLQKAQTAAPMALAA